MNLLSRAMFSWPCPLPFYLKYRNNISVRVDRAELGDRPDRGGDGQRDPAAERRDSGRIRNLRHGHRRSPDFAGFRFRKLRSRGRIVRDRFDRRKFVAPSLWLFLFHILILLKLLFWNTTRATISLDCFLHFLPLHSQWLIQITCSHLWSLTPRNNRAMWHHYLLPSGTANFSLES